MITELVKVALFSTAIFPLTGPVLFYQKQLLALVDMNMPNPRTNHTKGK
jgi:hypothetical protein